MKTLYVTEDGKEFESKEKAAEYEANLDKNASKKKAIMEQIERNNAAIEDLKDEIREILDKNDVLLKEYKKYLDPETKEKIDRVDRLFDLLFGTGDSND